MGLVDSRPSSAFDSEPRTAQLISKQEGITHAFVFIFASPEDRAYYLHKDPAHLSFVEVAGEFIEKAIVVDYEPNVF